MNFIILFVHFFPPQPRFNQHTPLILITNYISICSQLYWFYIVIIIIFTIARAQFSRISIVPDNNLHEMSRYPLRIIMMMLTSSPCRL